jgi:hypothetical protein
VELASNKLVDSDPLATVDEAENIMTNIVINTFTQFQLNEHEQLSGTLMSNEQKMFVQTQIAGIAEQRLALTPDPTSYAAFIQQEAYLKGQMDFAKFLLDSSTASEQIVASAQAEQQPS